MSAEELPAEDNNEEKQVDQEETIQQPVAPVEPPKPLTREEILAQLASAFGEPADPPAKEKGIIALVLAAIAIPTIAELLAGRAVPVAVLDRLSAHINSGRSAGFAIGLGAQRRGANLFRSRAGDVLACKANVQKLLKHVEDYAAMFKACGVADMSAFMAAVAKLP